MTIISCFLNIQLVAPTIIPPQGGFIYGCTVNKSSSDCEMRSCIQYSILGLLLGSIHRDSGSCCSLSIATAAVDLYGVNVFLGQDSIRISFKVCVLVKVYCHVEFSSILQSLEPVPIPFQCAGVFWLVPLHPDCFCWPVCFIVVCAVRCVNWDLSCDLWL